MNDHDPSLPNLELSQETLATLFHDLGESVILNAHAESLHFAGHLPAIEGGQVPQAMRVPLDKKVVKSLFYSHDSGLIPASGSEASYLSPHRINEDGDTVYEAVGVVCRSIISSDHSLQYIEMFRITKENGVYNASVWPRYSDEHGNTISPNNAPAKIGVLDDDAVMDILDDDDALDRPLTIDDAEHLQALTEVLRGR